MKQLEDCLKNRLPHFKITLPLQLNIAQWIENQLVNLPYLLTTIANLSYRTRVVSHRAMQIHFSVIYTDRTYSGMVFGVKDTFELVTAVSIAMKCHLSKIVLVIDNRTGFISKNTLADQFEVCKEYVGAEFENNQFDSSSSICRMLFNNRLIIYTLDIHYFDDAEAINYLSCQIAEQAKLVREACGDNDVLMVNTIMHWFRQHVQYRKTSSLSDHSAVGLFEHKTAVCQGIAAYAYLLLSFCGVDARYVKGHGNGSGGWGAHGWNMVKLQGVWHHIDYTFELNSNSAFLFKTEREFKQIHRWDDIRYSPQLSDELAKTRRTLNASVVVLCPGENYLFVNGCLIDTTASHAICLVSNGIVYVSMVDLVKFYGGCYQLVGNIIKVYLGTNAYLIPSNGVITIGELWYVDVLWMRHLNLSISTEDHLVVLKNNN